MEKPEAGVNVQSRSSPLVIREEISLAHGI